jgi:4'-phosphopantetheinyl transferase EntD
MADGIWSAVVRKDGLHHAMNSWITENDRPLLSRSLRRWWAVNIACCAKTAVFKLVRKTVFRFDHVAKIQDVQIYRELRNGA